MDEVFACEIVDSIVNGRCLLFQKGELCIWNSVFSISPNPSNTSSDTCFIPQGTANSL